MVITIVFTWGDMEDIRQTPTLYPFIQVFYNTTQSLAGAAVMTVIIILTLLASAIAITATASRQIWSFARDNGVPYSAIVSRVGLLPKSKTQLIALGLSGMEHSREYCHHLSSCRQVHHRPQCLVQSRRRQWHHFIHDLYWLSREEASEWKTSPSTTMVVGSLWDGYQYRKSLLLSRIFGLWLLSACESCGTNHYELGLLDIWIRHHFLHHILYRG